MSTADTTASSGLMSVISLRGKAAFAAVKAQRVSSRRGVLRVAVAPNSVAAIRVGYAISGVKLATVRNRLRRRLRAAVSPAVEQERSQSSGFDMVVHAGTDAAAAPFAALRDNCDHAVRSALAQLAERALPVGSQ